MAALPEEVIEAWENRRGPIITESGRGLYGSGEASIGNNHTMYSFRY